MRITLLGLFFSVSILVFSQDLQCGIATGFPPFQYEENDLVTGFDAEVVNTLFDRLEIDFIFKQDKWDFIYNLLRLNKIDLISGMEINDTRKQYFSFTSSYYKRYEVVITLADSEYVNLEDLKGEIISGDRQSYIENLWVEQGIRNNYRIKQTDSKEESIKLLIDKKVEAAIMPKMVASHLAITYNTKVRIIETGDPGTPVGIAVVKGNNYLLNIVNNELNEMIVDGSIQTIYNKWLLRETF